MEFWGVEVKPGETVKCEPGDDKYIHLSQASLGETKKAGENVPLFVKCDDKKLVVGTLSGEKCAQIQYDLVFEKEFELSHGSKNVSVYFCGYKTVMADEGDDMFDDDSDSEEEEEDVKPIPLKVTSVNGKPKIVEDKVKAEENAKADGPKKADALKPKPEEKPNKPKSENADDSDEDDDDDSDEDDEDDSDEEPKELKMMELDANDEDDDGEDDDDDEDDDDEDESDEEEEEATPQKNGSKKRPLKDAQKTPGQDSKKAKLVSPAGTQKTDGKKGGHVATPHPAKQAPKTPAASNDKSKQKPQTPKSAGSVSCKSCNKTFNSENALQSHTKAKHG